MKTIKAVIFDWAGTTIDYGCMAPIYAMQNAFSKHAIDVTLDEIRKPMGLSDTDHIKSILSIKRVLHVFQAQHKRLPEEDDVQHIRQEYEKGFSAVLSKHAVLIDGVLEVQQFLKRQHIKIGTTTGYSKAMLAIILQHANEQGFEPDFVIASDEVNNGRPQPDMIQKNMHAFKIKDPKQVIKLGGTLADIQEAKQANCWSLGVVLGSSMLGMTQKDVKALKPEQLEGHLDAVKQEMLLAGADFVIDRLKDLPPLIESINQEMSDLQA